ncbi:hypothetical protein DFQ26_004252 [Actinomortierella ambigua]|nr:hypothetical protein DFQ26_004252 [Actinomortierella ambigua]
MDESFENDLQGYYKARASATSVAKATDQEQENSTPEVTAASYLHPEGFIPLQDQPNFSHDPNTQMWYDASTQVYSYYDSTSGTYIPIPPSQSDEISNEYHDYEGYAQQEHHQHQYLEVPPESDATLRLRVLSSDILTVGGIVSMDASGLSFGRDRPLVGQGKRLRLSELDISRFHASIFLNREWIQATNTVVAQDSEQEVGNGRVAPAEQTSKEDLPSTITGKEAEAPRRSEEEADPQMVAHMDQSSEGSQSSEDAKTEETIEETGNTPKGGASNEDASAEDEKNKEQEEGELDEDEDGDEDEGDTGSTSPSTPLNGKTDEQEGQEEGVITDVSTLHAQYYAEYYALQPPHYEQPSISAYEDIFQIYDCGSTHGTFLNGERLSPPKAASQPFTLSHLDQLKLGSTTFEVHAHEEGRVCADCQARDDNELEVLDDKERAPTTQKPANNVDLNQNKLTIEQQRIEEVNRLKKKWSTTGARQSSKQPQHQQQQSHQSQQRSKHGIAQAGSAVNGHGSNMYVDRAAKRRLLNPDKSSPPSLPSVSRYEDGSESPQVTTGFHIAVGAQNKGYAMLSKMGWKEGTGLGLDQHGVVEPVQLKVSQQRAGLGSSLLQTQGAAAEKQQQGRKETMGEIARRQARERFAQLQK